MVPDPKTIVGSRDRIAVLNLEGDVVEHAHPQAQVMIKIDGPDRLIVVAGRRYVLAEDTMIILPPWVAHAGMATAAQSSSVLSINAGVPARATGAASRDTVVCKALDPRQRRTANEIRDRLVRGHSSVGDADEMLESFSEACSCGYDPSPNGTIDFRIRKVVDHISRAPADAQSVAAWIDVAGLSRQHFFQLFREYIGVTPRLYANSIRLERALDRLSRSTTPIHQLSQSLGFRAPSHFTRFFVDNFGSTPRAYRRGSYVVAD
ncbi:AraC family transcriptional regulator [Bradyrhizobium sp. NP1]|uniref:helix-turn-helix domain-containing protein n=1 Tax=Bradyrhizobium sp. NP1 TaxID=3049772 RepID=UPI0025A57E32|nr:AraC family transcriptional regulator [Bradyrhizobium sp. NP1]WJR80213.1 AraC family transcriptional regulator [Bradyrhizobium sp. NP1]